MGSLRNTLPINNVSRKNLRSNPEQIRYMVDYMSTHNMFALEEFTGPLGRRAHNEEWVRLQGALKELGPDKTVEQWKNTWRDLKKKARFDGARHNEALNKTGNKPDFIPPVPSTSSKILNIIGTESAYGIGQNNETGLGEFPADVIVVEDYTIATQEHHNPYSLSTSPPPYYSPPRLSPCPSPHITSSYPPTTLPDSPTLTPQLSSDTLNTRRRPLKSAKNDFLASDESTRNVLQEINNNLKIKNDLTMMKMRRNVKERLHKYRQDTMKNLGN